MRSILGMASLLGVVVALQGCVRNTASVSSAADGEPGPSHVSLVVDNHNWSDVVVYLGHDGQRTRLGTVKAASRQNLRIPVMFLGNSHPVYLVAHRIGSTSEFRSESFAVQHDQIIDWSLESDLQLSTVALR